MSKLLVGLLGLFAACALSASSADAYSLNNREGRFSAELPDEPKFEKLREQTKAGYHVDRYQWLVDKGETAWIITYGDYPPADVRRIGVETMYDNGVQGSVEGVKGTLRDQGPVDHSGVRGRELFVHVPEGNLVMRQRLFILNNRLYQNVYVGPDGTERTPEVEAFLNSFRMRR